MERTAVINVVGLTPSLLGPDTPALSAFAKRNRLATIRPVVPAVTCTAQSTYLTGTPPACHGIVANGWYDRDDAEVRFWKQSNRLVRGPKLWETLRASNPDFTCAKLFWWYNMYSSADYSITPRPMYPADGRKIFDIYTHPAGIRTEIKRDLGEFPFPTFWGPAAGVNTRAGNADAASQWIAGSARWIESKYQPTLSLIYLPHLDYNLQRLGPSHPAIAGDLRAIDRVAGDLIAFLESRSIRVAVLSEYGITPVDAPVHLNRLFREHNWIAVRDELGLERLDPGASEAFAVADHQIAHIYLKDPALAPKVRALVERQPGVARVFEGSDRAAIGLDHPRSGDLVALTTENAWFTYYYWLDDAKAPDFARCVDIHRKPGYDPVELFLDPNIAFPQLKIAGRLLRKKLGMRMLMDVIPLDATLVKGSHGVVPTDTRHYPVLIGPADALPSAGPIPATEVHGLLKNMIGR